MSGGNGFCECSQCGGNAEFLYDRYEHEEERCWDCGYWSISQRVECVDGKWTPSPTGELVAESGYLTPDELKEWKDWSGYDEEVA